MVRRTASGKIMYTEEQLKIGVALRATAFLPVGLLLHLVKNHTLKTFSIIFLHADFEDFENFLHEQKRDTDLLYTIDQERHRNLLLCQETHVDGGVYFMRRLEERLREHTPQKIKAAVVGVETLEYSVDDLLYFVMDNYVKLSQEGAKNIIYRTIR